MPLDDHRRLQSSAWGGSLALHMLLTGSVAWFAGNSPQGAVGEQSREIGVVLRRDRVESFAAEDTGPAPTPDEFPDESDPADGPPIDAHAATMPSPGDSPFTELVERLTAQGSGATSAIGLEGPPRQGGAGGQGLRELAKRGMARVTVFGVSGEGNQFVYAFDRSISMAGPPLTAAKNQLIASLDSLAATHQFQILFFNTAIMAFDLTGGQSRIAFATDQNKRLAADYVRGVTADGGTERFGALKRALAYNPDVIFFLTDADLAMTPAEVQEIADRNAGGATINTIEFGRGPKPRQRNFLEDLAEATGGEYGYVDLTRLVRPRSE